MLPLAYLLSQGEALLDLDEERAARRLRSIRLLIAARAELCFVFRLGAFFLASAASSFTCVIVACSPRDLSAPADFSMPPMCSFSLHGICIPNGEAPCPG